MTTVAIIADSHFDEHSRFDECVKIHRWIADDLAQRGVDLILHAGDVYERKSTPRERMEAARFFQRCASVAPVVIVRGNHDAIGDLPLLARLDSGNDIIVVERTEVVPVGGCVVGCLAWPTKSSVLATGAQSSAEGELLAGEALRNVVLGLGVEMANHRQYGTPRILLAHAMVRGSLTSTGQPLVGCDLEIGVDDLELADADFVALGHIHRGQSFELAGGPRNVVYPGSPRRTAFGELEQKGYVLAHFDDDGEFVDWELIHTPCAGMVLVEDEWGFDDESNKQTWLVGWHGMPASVAGAEVRMRYRVAADQRDAARASAELMRDRLISEGAVNVKIDPQVIAANMARAPEVAKATTLDAKLKSYWGARGTTPEPQRSERLIEMASGLESEQ